MTRRPSDNTTIVTASVPGELSPIEAAIMDCCNAVHEARSREDNEGVRRLRRPMEQLLQRYEETDAENHPNSAWARPNQRALALSAFGETQRAIEAEKLALRYADNARRKEISFGNLAERYIRVGDFEAAVACFLEAIEVAPSSVPVMLTGAQALYLAGCTAEADNIFAAFLDMPDQFDSASELTAYLDHEPRLRSMAAELPALRELLDRRAEIAAREVLS